MAESIEDLIGRIVNWPYGMPVRAMEEVRARGEAAIPALTDALVRGRDDEDSDLLWPVVLLGEIGHPGAVAPLVEAMRHPDQEYLALAAVEALAKIGVDSVPALIEAVGAADPLVRLHAYAGLGWIADERCFRTLADALVGDRALGDVVAQALARQGRREAIPLLYASYRECEPWQRAEFEDALWSLHHGHLPDPLWREDWRLRYRRLAELQGGIELDWLGVCAVVHGQEERPERPELPLRSLEAIVADPGGGEAGETCEECGAPVEWPTGLPVCPETAVSTAVYQLRLLDDARRDGIEDLFELLDELEGDEFDRRDAGEPRAPRARERWHDEIHELQMCRETCHWLIGQGVESVAPARALLLAETARLAERCGDPEGLLKPASPVRSAGPKVGRNERCPCGSGRKYKHCCLGRT